MSQPKRGAATANAVESAAVRLVLELGYSEVTVDMICDAVGISQRTFFNYFPTKDDALLGREMPRVDERAARRFILSDGPLLLDALSLVSLPDSQVETPSFDDRIRVAASSPSLMSKQMERMGAIEKELREIIGLRIEREHPERPEDEREDEATMVANLITGVVKFTGFASQNGAVSFPELEERARGALARVLQDSPVTNGGGSPSVL